MVVDKLNARTQNPIYTTKIINLMENLFYFLVFCSWNDPFGTFKHVFHHYLFYAAFNRSHLVSMSLLMYYTRSMAIIQLYGHLTKHIIVNRCVDNGTWITPISFPKRHMLTFLMQLADWQCFETINSKQPNRFFASRIQNVNYLTFCWCSAFMANLNCFC